MSNNYFGATLPSSNSSLFSAANAGSSKARAMADSTTANAGDSSLSVDNLGSTFLSLLAQELQNQDPTQPMSPTEEVGQMISLNQLNQLVSINNVLTGVSSSTASTSGTTGSNGASPDVQASKAVDAATAQPSTEATSDSAKLQQKLAESGLASSTQPLDLGTLMSLYGGK